jgi:hypothetical protein
LTKFKSIYYWKEELDILKKTHHSQTVEMKFKIRFKESLKHFEFKYFKQRESKLLFENKEEDKILNVDLLKYTKSKFIESGNTQLDSKYLEMNQRELKVKHMFLMK